MRTGDNQANNIMVPAYLLPRFFSSRAKSAILLLLGRRQEPCYLREIASAIQLPIYSVQTAIKNLIKLGAIIGIKDGRHVMYQINPAFAFARLIQQVAEIETCYKLKLRATNYTARAEAVISFLEEEICLKR